LALGSASSPETRAKAAEKPSTPLDKLNMNRKLFFLLMIGAFLVIAVYVHQARSTQLKNFSPNAPATPQAPVQVFPEKAGVGETVAHEAVAVIRPEKSEAAAVQLPAQLSA